MTFTTSWRILILFMFLECVKLEICRFPEFLQSGKKNHKLQPWITRSWWINIRDNPKMREKREIYVQDSQMWVIHEEDKIKCERKTRRLPQTSPQIQHNDCISRRQILNRTCIVREPFNKYRVAQFSDDGRSVVYVCMSFTFRSSNIVQITQGPMRSKNLPDLCSDLYMSIDDWPWIASWKPETSACPVAGGFTFRTISRLTNQDVCKSDWRRSKLEIECLNGDGMDFFAPKESSCNPFLSQGDWKRVYCWGGWSYGNFSYMIASGEENEPHFCMRFPARTGKEFVALLYFSPICPTAEDGQPPTGIDYYELHLRRTDHNECEDENEEACKRHAEKGMCDKTNNRFKQHCRKTCGLCEDIADKFWTMVCPFDELVRGKWLLFEDNMEEKVIINKSHIYFSNLGHFICQERTPDNLLYKLVSNFKNGCSTRHTCIELKRPHRNILQFRLGRSYREDKHHTEMCNFKKDAHLDVVESRYRSYWKKNLILQGALWESHCGLWGTIPFNAILEGQRCTGSFSDWDAYTCTYNTHITISTNNCFGMNKESQYQCIALLDDDEFQLSPKMSPKMILTRAMDGSNEFVCWILTEFPGEDFSYPITRIYKMPNLQCSSFANVKNHITRHQQSYFNMLFNENLKVCEPEVNPTQAKPQNDSNITSIEEKDEVIHPPYLTPKEPPILKHLIPNRNSSAKLFSINISVIISVLTFEMFCMVTS